MAQRDSYNNGTYYWLAVMALTGEAISPSKLEENNPDYRSPLASSRAAGEKSNGTV
jgi:hypothetical protein